LPDDRYKKIALDTFENILKRQHNWKGKYNKAYPEQGSLRILLFQ
jgi:N-acylglucosamine 2-epimerase